VLPLEFSDGDKVESLDLTGTETFDLSGLGSGDVRPKQDVSLTINRADGSKHTTKVVLRIDTPIELEYYKSGGILPFVLRQLLDH